MKIPAHNSTFAIGGVTRCADSLVVVESFVLFINKSFKNPAHHKSAKVTDKCKMIVPKSIRQ